MRLCEGPSLSHCERDYAACRRADAFGVRRYDDTTTRPRLRRAGTKKHKAHKDHKDRVRFTGYPADVDVGRRRPTLARSAASSAVAVRRRDSQSSSFCVALWPWCPSCQRAAGSRSSCDSSCRRVVAPSFRSAEGARGHDRSLRVKAAPICSPLSSVPPRSLSSQPIDPRAAAATRRRSSGPRLLRRARYWRADRSACPARRSPGP